MAHYKRKQTSNGEQNLKRRTRKDVFLKLETWCCDKEGNQESVVIVKENVTVNWCRAADTLHVRSM